MGRRIKPTHRATFYRPADGSDSYTEDPQDTDKELLAEDEPVRFWGRGGLVRTATGEYVERGPDITANGELAQIVREGDKIDLEPVSDAYRSYTDLEATYIREVYGRSPEPIKARIRLDGV